MDIVNFPGIIAEHGLLSSAQVDLAKDLILIGKKMGVQRDGTQYENMGITVQDLIALASGGAQTLAQTLALGNITGGLNVVFSGGSQAVFNSGAFSGGLTTLALTGNQTWSLPNQSGTIALLSDIPVTLYTGDGSTTGVRTVTLGSDLIFQFASLQGSLQLTDGGGFYLRTSDPQDSVIFFPDGTADYLAVNTENLVSMGFRATHTIGGTVDSFAELIVTDIARAYLNISTDTTQFDFYTNNLGILAGTIDGPTGNWGFGGSDTASTKVTITGVGSTAATNTQIWKNLGGLELARMTDNGVLCIGATTPSSYLGTAQKLHIDSTVSSDYSPSVIINQFYSQTANNSNTASVIYTNLYKGTAFNTLELFGAVNGVRNDGTGNITTMAAHQAFAWNTGTATGTINEMFSYYARTQTQEGTFTNLGGIVIQHQELLNTTATNLIGVYVKSPVNVLGGNVLANTYGILIEQNSAGTNNYGVAVNGSQSNGLGLSAPNQQAMLHIRANHDPVFKAHVYFEPITSAQASTITPSNGMGVYVSDTNGTFTSIGFWKYENGAWAAW